MPPLAPERPARPPASRAGRRSAAVTCAVALCLAGLLAGCSGATDGVGANAAHASAGPHATLIKTPAPRATSDVKGRKFDVGTIADTATVDGVLTLQLDRWTVTGVSDSKVAKSGITVTPHTGTRFTNQNDDRTRTVPVAPGAIVAVNTCVRPDHPDGELGMTSVPQAAADWLKDADDSTVVLLTYDDAGRVTRLDTDPRC